MKFSILGTGSMGTAMGEAILNAGHELIVYNRTTDKTKALVDKGAKAVLSPAEAIEKSDISIFLMIDSKVVKSILNESSVLAIIKDKKIINASTSNVEETLQIKEIVVSNGGTFVEMSLQAVPDTLRTASGCFNIGCEKEEESFWIETLSSFSGEVTRIGEIGDVSKIDVITIAGATLSLAKAAYIIALAQKYNISPDMYKSIMTMSESMAEYYIPNMVGRNYDNIIGNVEGNIELVNMLVEGIKSQGISTEVFEEMIKIFEKASKMGYSQKDGSAILEVLLNGNRL